MDTPADIRQKQAAWTAWQEERTFENFVSGSSNQLAVQAAKAAADLPGHPLFFYGPPGVGKTHLLYAMANRIREASPEKKVVYVLADQFTAELIQGIHSGNMAAFQEKYRRADVLLVDDIQFLVNKEATQEAFFRTFQVLFSQGKQIVMTADRHPAGMATLEVQLRERFNSGILIGIAPPDRQLRLAIAARKAEQYRLQLEPACIAYVVDAFPQSVPAMEGGLKKLRAFHDLAGEPLTLENIRRLLKG